MFELYRIHLKTTDVVSTAQWYMDLLGGKNVEDYRRDGNHNILVDVDGVEIIITQPPDASDLPVAPHDPHLGLEHIGLVTDDYEGLLAKIEEQGLEILITSPPDRPKRYVVVRAPDGVRLELVEG